MPPEGTVTTTRIRGSVAPHARHAAGRHRDSAEGLRVLLSLADRARVGRVIVFIPAHNEAASIKETISSLRRQTRPPDEIIVVSDNSSDATTTGACCTARRSWSPSGTVPTKPVR
jgi:Glycosyl transferase family 2